MSRRYRAHHLRRRPEGAGHLPSMRRTRLAAVFGDPVITGTTRGPFTPTGVNGAVVSIAGTVDLRLIRGALNTKVSGTFDTASGKFSVTTSSLTGTRGLSGASGRLTLSGTQDPQGRFTETIRGSLFGIR